MTHELAVTEIEALTGDVYRLRLDRPEGYRFTPGQATDLAIDRDGMRDETRPFTFTSRPGDPFLEFTIKSYPAHEGVTALIPTLKPGDCLRIGDPWGAIRDEGPGVIIAGGAGLTPFIPILRERRRMGWLTGMTLIEADKTWDALILRDEWRAMPGLDAVFVLEDEDHEECERGRVDRALLERHGVTPATLVYLCGPPPMMEAVTGALRSIGVPERQVVQEDL